MNLCRSCGKDFGGVSGFDAHRVGKHAYLFSEDHPDGRRCLTTDEMIERGFTQAASGSWSNSILAGVSSTTKTAVAAA